MRHIRIALGLLLAVLLINGVVAAAAPEFYDQVWGDRVDERDCILADAVDGVEFEECEEPTTTSTTQPPETSTTTEPPTTTSTSTVTTTTTPPAAASDIAGIGCSNTRQAIQGYLTQSSEDNLINLAQGGVTISDWNSAQGRNFYTANRPAGGYDGVWLQLCEMASAGLDPDDVTAIIDHAWSLDPDIPIWVSPLNFYEEEMCGLTNGNEIPDAGAAIADQLAGSMDNVHRGPDLGPLTDSLLQSDNCHPDSDGVDLLGSQLVEFFDGTPTTTPPSTTTTTSVVGGGGGGDLTIPATQPYGDRRNGYREGGGYDIIAWNADTGQPWWQAEYWGANGLAGYPGHGAWIPGDREAYRCGYGFVVDASGWDIHGRFAFVRPPDQAYGGVNDRYMSEAERYLDGTPYPGPDTQEIPDENCRDVLSPIDYSNACRPVDERPRVGFFDGLGNILDIRDYSNTNATGVWFNLHDFDGTRATVIACTDEGVGMIVYYDALGAGQLAVDFDGTGPHG